MSAGNGDPLALAFRRERACSHPHHRTDYSKARCLWRRAEWVAGRGRWSVLAHCRVLTITLHATRRDAEDSLGEIDAFGCGSGCERFHEVVFIEEEVAA